MNCARLASRPAPPGCPRCWNYGPGCPPGEAGTAETSILFAVEPPGSALLIAVLDGAGAIREHRGDAVAAARDGLRQARSGQDPELAAHCYPDAGAVLAAFG